MSTKVTKDIGSNAADAALTVGSALRDVADDLATLVAAAPAALTAGAAAATTAVAPSAATASAVATANAATQSGSYVQADVQTITALANALKTAANALIVDCADLRTQLTALRVDFLDLRTKYGALLTDVTAMRSATSTASGVTLKVTKA